MSATEPVRIAMVLEDGRRTSSRTMARFLAELELHHRYARGLQVNGQRVVRARIVPVLS